MVIIYLGIWLEGKISFRPLNIGPYVSPILKLQTYLWSYFVTLKNFRRPPFVLSDATVILVCMIIYNLN